MARTSSPSKATTAPAKKTAAKKTTSGSRAPRKTAAKTAAKKTSPPRLSLVKDPSAQIPVRRSPFMTDVQGYATLAARLAGITTPSIRDWRDHRNQTATRPLHDGSTLHYNLTERALTWQASCPMGAVHIYTLTSPSTAAAARVHADRCTETHADFTHIPRLTPDELEALGLLQTPTWARPDIIGDDFTATKVVPVPVKDRALGDELTHATSATDETQPMNTRAIAAHIAETAKEHPHG